jgi:predicted GIY-YIG superfamily endonuclease
MKQHPAFHPLNYSPIFDLCGNLSHPTCLFQPVFNSDQGYVFMPEIFYVYILHCADGTYYTGYSGNLSRRLKQHQSGSIPRAYTKPRRPIKLVWASEFESKEEARGYEKKLKSWSTPRKEKLIAEGKTNTDQIKEDRGIPD